MIMLTKTRKDYENARVQKSALVENSYLNNFKTKRKEIFPLFMRRLEFNMKVKTKENTFEVIWCRLNQ